jgi:hypothetical protein
MAEQRTEFYDYMEEMNYTHGPIPEDWWERDFQENPLKVLSYGGGTQSTAMLALVKMGIISRPDIVIHSDTGSELPETVEFVEVARKFVEEELKIPFIIVRSHRGSLHEDYLKQASIPIIGARSCTQNFKIRPQRRLIRKIVGNRRGKVLADCMLGITTDEESRRVDESDIKWATNSFPLLDEIRMTRQECIDLNNRMGWVVKKSGCFCCCYQGTKTWKNLKRDHPDLFQISLDMEEKKFAVRGGKMGLHQYNKLSTIDEMDLPDSGCDSGAGCFL